MGSPKIYRIEVNPFLNLKNSEIVLNIIPEGDLNSQSLETAEFIRDFRAKYPTYEIDSSLFKKKPRPKPFQFEHIPNLPRQSENPSSTYKSKKISSKNFIEESLTGLQEWTLSLAKGTFAENLRAVRQVWRSLSAGVIAYKFPLNGPRPSEAELGVFGSKPGFGFGVLLPGLALIASINRMDRFAKSPFATPEERLGTELATGIAATFFDLGLVNLYANYRIRVAQKAAERLSPTVLATFVRETGSPRNIDKIIIFEEAGKAPSKLWKAGKALAKNPWSRVASWSGKAMPFVGGIYSAISGYTHYLSGKNNGYLSPEANIALSGGEMAAGTVSLLGAVLMFSKGAALVNPWAKAGVVFVGAVMTLGFPEIHDHYSGKGAGEKIADAIDLAPENYKTSHKNILYQLKLAKSYGLFNETSVFALLTRLQETGKLSQIDWRDHKLVLQLRRDVYNTLHTSIDRAIFPDEETVAAHFYFGMQFYDEKVQKETIEVFEKYGDEEDWKDFISKYGSTEDQDISDFFLHHVNKELANRMLSQALHRLIDQEA